VKNRAFIVGLVLSLAAHLVATWVISRLEMPEIPEDDRVVLRVEDLIEEPPEPPEPEPPEPEEMIFDPPPDDSAPQEPPPEIPPEPEPPPPDLPSMPDPPMPDLDIPPRDGPSDSSASSRVRVPRARDRRPRNVDDPPQRPILDEPADAVPDEPKVMDLDLVLTGGTGGLDGPPDVALPRGPGRPSEPEADQRKPRPETTARHKISSPAKVRKSKPPEYPESVRPLNIQGRVSLELVVDETGKVVYVALVKGLHPELDRVAMEAAWKLTFEPALQEGVAVKATIPYRFAFVLR
jgi:protein TonB